MIKRFLIIFTLIGILLLGYFSIKPSPPNFETYQAGQARKTAFFNYFTPLIIKQNHTIKQNRTKLQYWQQNRDDIGWWDARKIHKLAEKYRVKNFSIENDVTWQQLLRRVNVIPPSLILAQAANESAWGTSRFAKQGNNYFGQWCFTQGCGLVPKERGSGKVHEVAAFESPEQSLESYMNNLNSHPAYKKLRDIRSQRRKEKLPLSGKALAAGLNNYSERGEEYITELRDMMNFNKLAKYDEGL